MVLVGRPLDHRSGRWITGALALALPATLLLAGCSEPPSFLLSWELDHAQITPADAAPKLSTIEQCATVGVSKVRVTTMLGGCSGIVVDAREYPCSSADTLEKLAVEGPTLEPGEYTLLIEGLRRSGEPWACEQDICDPDPLLPPCVAQASVTVTVADGDLPERAVVLLSPPQCDDGIDNDRDGRVDGRDPACILDPAGLEAADASFTLFETSVTFLGSAAIKPFNVGVDALVLEVDGEPFTVIADYQLDLTQWPYRLPLLSRGIDPGPHEFSITAVAAGLVPLTQPIPVPFTVDEDQAAFVLGQFDFTDALFLEPIIAPISFNASLRLSPDVVTLCELGGHGADNQKIRLERMWVRVTANGSPLDAAALGFTGNYEIGLGESEAITPIDEPGGWVSFECPSSIVDSIPLAWGGYEIEVQGRIGGEVCFSTPMVTELAPQPSSATELSLERVLVGAEPVPACYECSINNDCSGQVCIDHVCVDKEPPTNG